eukprot:g31701.t1
MLKLVEQGDVPNLRALIEDGHETDFAPENATTPLTRAVETRNTEVVQLLLELRANVNFKDWKGVAPLHVAAFDGDIDTMSLLLTAGADANAGGAQVAGRSPRVAIGGGPEWWLTEHASPGLINVQDKHGRTAWYCASRAGDESGNTETLQVLKEKKPITTLKPYKEWKVDLPPKPQTLIDPVAVRVKTLGQGTGELCGGRRGGLGATSEAARPGEGRGDRGDGIPERHLPPYDPMTMRSSSRMDPGPPHVPPQEGPQDPFAVVSLKRSTEELRHLSEELSQADTEVMAVLQDNLQEESCSTSHASHLARARWDEPSTAELVKDAEDLLQEGASHEAEARDGASPGRKGFGRSASGEFRAPAV